MEKETNCLERKYKYGSKTQNATQAELEAVIVQYWAILEKKKSVLKIIWKAPLAILHTMRLQYQIMEQK